MAGQRGGVIDEKCPNCGAPLAAGETVVCTYCGSRLRRLGEVAHRSEAAPAGVDQALSVGGLHLRPYVLTDSEGLGGEVLRMLVPADWQVEGGVRWDLQNVATPGLLSLQVHNTMWTEAFEIFPALWFFWSGNPLQHLLQPTGSKYFGAEVRRPVPAQQVLRELVVPRYRQYAQGLRVVTEHDAPELAQLVRASAGVPGAQAEGRRMRVSYRFRDLIFEEEFFAGVLYIPLSLPGVGTGGPTYWGADSVFSMRAPAGQLDERAGLYQAMLHSVRVNPAWSAAYAQLKTQLAQGRIQHIRQIGAMSRQIAHQSEQMRQENLAAYESRQAVYDRLSLDWSQTIRGVDEYYDPFQERPVELPGGYTYAWTNAFGECIVTDNPNLDPNVGSNQTWQPMPRRGT